MRASAAPLDNFPLEPLAGPAARRPLPPPSVLARAAGGATVLELDRAPELIPTRRRHDPADEPPPGRTKVRPLARFAQSEESPNFYLSLSDIMCLLLVFFVLIFSLSKPWSDRPAETAAREPERSVTVMHGSVPGLPAALAGDDSPLPGLEAQPVRVELGIVAVSAGGTADPGLTAPADPRPSAAVEPESVPAPASLLALINSSEEHPEPSLLLPESVGEPPARPAAPAPTPAAPPAAQGQNQLAQAAAQAVRDSLPGVTVRQDKDRVLLRLPEKITFASAQADIRPETGPLMKRLARAMNAYPDTRVVVTGHTDDRPINTPQFASNWELSAARAAAVARALTANGLDPARVTIQGQAEREPLAPNDSEANRQKNRRVEIELSRGPRAAAGVAGS